MRRCRSVYWCFIGAVFLLSLYNFVALTLLDAIPPASSSDDCLLESCEQKRKNLEEGNGERKLTEVLEEKIELEFEESNNHVFQEEDSDELEELEMLEEPLPEPKIFWPGPIELALPHTDQNLPESCENFRKRVESVEIGSTEPAGWKTCGRANNAFVHLSDSTPLCVRHRSPHDYLTAGDVLSSYLAQQLGLQTVPCVITATVKPADKWKIDIERLGWNESDTVGLIQWVSAPKRIVLPDIILRALETGKSLFWSEISSLPQQDLVDLAQWSDLIVFDYLTGHYDRVASLQDEAEKQDNADLMRDHVRNMGVDDAGAFWFFDNEAGLLDAYILMYQAVPNANHLRFQGFHQKMLQTLCVFRRNTVHAVNNLYQRDNQLNDFLDFVRSKEPLLDKFRFETDVRFKLLQEHFSERITNLIAHWKFCSDRQTPSTNVH